MEKDFLETFISVKYSVAIMESYIYFVFSFSFFLFFIILKYYININSLSHLLYRVEWLCGRPKYSLFLNIAVISLFTNKLHLICDCIAMTVLKD